MKWLAIFILFFSFQALAKKDLAPCEQEARKDLLIFIEDIQGTTIGGAKIKLIEQTHQGPLYTSSFRMESMGTLWPIEHYDVVSDSENLCLTKAIMNTGSSPAYRH